MNINLQSQGFDLTSGIVAHTEKQITRHLSGASNDVISVEVFVGDINGPKGGVDKRALVCVKLASRLAVQYEARDTDLYRAVSLAARKTKGCVKKALRRQRQIARAELRAMRQFAPDLA